LLNVCIWSIIIIIFICVHEYSSISGIAEESLSKDKSKAGCERSLHGFAYPNPKKSRSRSFWCMEGFIPEKEFLAVAFSCMQFCVHLNDDVLSITSNLSLWCPFQLPCIFLSLSLILPHLPKTYYEGLHRLSCSPSSTL